MAVEVLKTHYKEIRGLLKNPANIAAAGKDVDKAEDIGHAISLALRYVSDEMLDFLRSMPWGLRFPLSAYQILETQFAGYCENLRQDITTEFLARKNNNY